MLPFAIAVDAVEVVPLPVDAPHEHVITWSSRGPKIAYDAFRMVRRWTRSSDVHMVLTFVASEASR